MILFYDIFYFSIFALFFIILFDLLILKIFGALMIATQSERGLKEEKSL